MTDERTLETVPGGLPTMLKAALPVLPGVNLIPGVAKKGGPLPDLVLHRRAVSVDASHVTAYAGVCGFGPSEHLPLPYLHMLSFPLQMAIMTDASFPFPAIGTVHLANVIHQVRPVSARERFDVTVRAADLRPHPKGKVFDLLTSVASDGDTVWESTSTYLRLGKGDAAAETEREPFDVVPGNGVEWRLPANLGRRYAAVSGDHNPIHLYPLTAKALGFKQQIAHGMWSLARCVAAVDSRLPDEATVEVEFKKPIFLPGKVAFGSHLVEGGIDFSLTSPKNGAPHLVGRSR
ncbi:MaoC family dehydratase [Nocardioides terrisoli]|uniref:MaoC family dehydratase n=1 Tax=Nocardioides terrisoli TaxID=3388267 RepID=UPI00287B702F|nr:MaoC/PaaZ C-terminal domain-containing protein [Nocardioides marmorisolisilvae]